MTEEIQKILKLIKTQCYDLARELILTSPDPEKFLPKWEEEKWGLLPYGYKQVWFDDFPGDGHFIDATFIDKYKNIRDIIGISYISLVQEIYTYHPSTRSIFLDSPWIIKIKND